MAQHCAGFFFAFTARYCGRLSAMSLWMPRSVALSLVATGTKPSLACAPEGSPSRANAAAAPAPASTSLRHDGVEAAGARGVGTAAGCSESPYDSELSRSSGMIRAVRRAREDLGEDARKKLVWGDN
eukprot:scaffold1730_cov68-Phaeocystis_antarctica.AAC.7